MKKYDIYFVNKEEGRKIASNLEKLRLMKDRGDVVVRLKYTDRKNISIEDIRRKYIMNSVQFKNKFKINYIRRINNESCSMC